MKLHHCLAGAQTDVWTTTSVHVLLLSVIKAEGMEKQAHKQSLKEEMRKINSHFLFLSGLKSPTQIPPTLTTFEGQMSSK